jgi:hypothetical protein
MKMKLLGGAALAAIGSLWLTPALASPMMGVNTSGISGYVDGGADYQTLGSSGAGTTENASNWNVDGAVFVPIGTNWAVQANGGYNSFHIADETLGTWNIGGSVMYVTPRVRIGGTVTYAEQTFSPVRLDGTSYGAFGDWYANPWLTLSARGGGISVTASGFGMSAHIGTAGYAGAQIVGYPTPNIAINGTVDYLSIPIEGTSFQTTSTGFGGEFRVFPKCPLSIGANYAYTNFRVLGENVNGSSFGFRLKYYFHGGDTLLDQQRSGAESWSTASPVSAGVVAFGF